MLKYYAVIAVALIGVWYWYQRKIAMDGTKHSWAVTRGLEPNGLDI